MHIITFSNFKGGVTKSSSVVNIGSALALLGHKVLLIDTDPQSHISTHLGIDAHSLDEGIENILEGKNRHLKDILVESSIPNLYVAPSRRRLRLLIPSLSKRVNKDALLSKAMRGLDEFFDFALIDTPMDENDLTMNALFACSHIIIPTALDQLSLEGIEPTMDAIISLKEGYEEKDWNILGVLINKYDKRNVIENRECLGDLENAFGNEGIIFETKIRVDEKAKRAVRNGKSIHQYNPKAKSAEDYTALAKEIVDRLTISQV